MSLMSFVNSWNLVFVLYFCISTLALLMMARQELSSETLLRGNRFTVLVALFMTGTALLLGWLFQPAVTLNAGLGFDGQYYASMFERFRTGHSAVPVEFPFGQRIGLPYLAAKMPCSPRPAFYLLHCAFWLSTMTLFVLLCRRVFQLPNFLALLALLWFQVHWLGVPRAASHYTFVVESASEFFMVAIAYLLLTSKHGALIFVAACVGAVFKESIVLWCTCLAFGVALSYLRQQYFGKPKIAWLVAASLGAFVVSNACQIIFLGQDHSSALDTFSTWTVIRIRDPFSSLRYLSAVCNALGPFVVLFICSGVRSIFSGLEKLASTDSTICDEVKISNSKKADEAVSMMLPALAAYLVICFFSGSDLTRFAFASFPLFVPVVLYAVTAHVKALPNSFAFAILLLSLPVTHLFSLAQSPQVGRETPNQDVNGPYSWMMEYAHPVIFSAWLLWFSAVSFCARKYVRFRLRI